ncbi:MAG: hypothetical protein J5845_01165 [Lachnospiraceae bacterium]|nr:hypothetical protein [Lachnospiraceae bacterium]
MDILKEQNAPQEYIDLVQYSVDGFNYIKDKVKENGFVTETDIREGERKYRKAREESAGRC